MKTAIRKIEWETKSSGKAIATITANCGIENKNEEINADGDKINVNRQIVTDDYNIVIDVSGQRITGQLIDVRHMQPYKNKGIIALVGKVAISDVEKFEMLENAITEAQAEARYDEDYQSWKIKDDNRLAGLAEYDKNCKEIEKIMTLNGKSY